MKKRITGIILTLCILVSLASVCFSGGTTAQTVSSSSSLVSLTFDGDAPYGMPVHRGVNVIEYASETADGQENGYLKLGNNANSGGQAYIGKDGAVGATPVTQRSSTEAKAEAKANLFIFEAGKTYRLKFDFKYLAGTGGTSRSITFFSPADPTASSISNYTFANCVTLIDSVAASATWSTEATVLTEDTAWQTAYYTFTVNSDKTDGISIGIHPGYSANYASYLAIDNLTIDEIISIEYNESRLHTMDDPVDDAYITASGCTEVGFVEDGEKHGSVLKLVGASNARLGFEDFDIKQNRKYYIYFDAKAETDNAQPITILGTNGSGTGSCRFFLTGFNTYRNDGIQYYVNGNRTTAANFKYSTDWKRYGIIIDTSNETLLSQTTSYQSDFWSKSIHFLFGVSGATAYFDNIQVIEVETLPEAVAQEDSVAAAGSIRTEKTAEDNNGVYQSAGLRFRAIIDNELKATADEIGFLVAPSLAVANDTDWYRIENGVGKNVRTGVCYQKDVKDIVYDESTLQTAYQMILTGLSTEDGRTAYIQRFTAAMYVKSGDTYTYYALGETSRNEVAASYRVMDVEFDDSLTDAGLLEIDDSWRTHPQDYKLIAFTFDDGPTAADGTNVANYQNKIINTLNKYGGAGTLFVIGSNVERYGTGQLQYAVDNGFEIGSHTMTHANINSAYLESRPDYTAQDFIDEQITPLNDLLYEKMGYEMKFLRASNGTVPTQVAEAAATVNMPLVFGNQDVNGNSNSNTALADYNSATTAEHIYNAVVNYAYDGKIVLMHGTSQQSADVLDSICGTLYKQGYRFVTLSELFEYKLKVTDMSQVDMANSFGGSAGIYDIDDVKLKYYNEDQWFLHPEDYKLLAFTFDDGPVYSEVGDNVTTKIIDAFEAYHGAGTFFFTGRSLNNYGATIPKYALSKGHELANHSANHSSLGTLAADKDATVNEVKAVNDWYMENLGYTCKFFRGGGVSSNSYMWEYLAEIDMPAINSVQGFSDYSGGTSTVEGIVNILTTTDFPNGSIILNHSTNSNCVTPDALAEALPVLYEKGYRFCTMSQLFSLQGIDYEDIPTDKYINSVTVADGVVTYTYK